MEKRDIILGSSFMIAHFSMGATLGDWFTVPETTDVTFGSEHISCKVYKDEAYNMFGSMCGLGIATVEKYMATLQILLSVAFGFSMILFFLVAFKRLDKRMIRLTLLIILTLEVASSVLWLTSPRVDLPTDFNYYGMGVIFSIITAVLSLLTILIV